MSFQQGLSGLNAYTSAVGAATLKSRYGARPFTYLLGALDAVSGRVHASRASRITVPRLVRFFQAVVAAYPHAATQRPSFTSPRRRGSPSSADDLIRGAAALVTLA